MGGTSLGCPHRACARPHSGPSRAAPPTREAGAEDLLLAPSPVHPLDRVVHHLCRQAEGRQAAQQTAGRLPACTRPLGCHAPRERACLLESLPPAAQPPPPPTKADVLPLAVAVQPEHQVVAALGLALRGGRGAARPADVNSTGAAMPTRLPGLAALWAPPAPLAWQVRHVPRATTPGAPMPGRCTAGSGPTQASLLRGAPAGGGTLAPWGWPPP